MASAANLDSTATSNLPNGTAVLSPAVGIDERGKAGAAILEAGVSNGGTRSLEAPRSGGGKPRPLRKPAANADAAAESRRKYNRDYMRGWRANPQNRLRDQENRRQWYYARKEREALREQSAEADLLGRPVCGFCHKRPPVEEVVRLDVCDSAPSGYVEVRMLYCGRC